MAKTDKDAKLRSEISKMIQVLRAEGMSQTAIAESLGVSGATVSLLKNQKYAANLNSHSSSLTKLLEDAGITDYSQVSFQNKDTEKPYGEWLAEKLEEAKLSPAELAQRATISTLTINYILDGTTSNPQAGTRTKIENAIAQTLGKAFKKSQKKPATKREIFSGILFNDQEIAQVPEGKGVYAIHDRRGYPTYIGKGNVKNRLKAHKDHKAFIDERVAYTFSYVILQKDTSKDAAKEADKEALWLENVLAKFAGNTVLLNKKLITDLSDAE